MGHVQRSVVINAAPEEVFGLMTDTRRYGDWVFGFAGLDEGPDRLAEGDRFRWRMKGHGLTLKPRSEVVELAAPRRYQEEIHFGRFLRATLTKTVTPQKRRTQLSWTLNYRVIGGPFGVALDWLMAHRVAVRAVEYSLKGAKRVLETSKATATTPRGGYRRQSAVR